MTILCWFIIIIISFICCIWLSFFSTCHVSLWMSQIYQNKSWILNVITFNLGLFHFDFHLLFIYYKSKKLRGRVSTGEAVDTLFSIPNKYSFVCTDRQIGWWTNERMDIRQRRTDGHLSVWWGLCSDMRSTTFLECAAKRSKMILFSSDR